VPIKTVTMTNLRLDDGDVIEYTSLQVAEGDLRPKGLQIMVVGLNSDGVEVNLAWIMQFTNLCEVIPFQDDDSLGWMVFVSVAYACLYYFCGSCILLTLRSSHPAAIPLFI